LLALFLTSKDDYEKAQEALKDEVFIIPAHGRIKEAIYAIGSHFNNLEDLEYKLRDRLAAEGEALTALFEVIYKADEMKKQNTPSQLMLLDCRKKVLTARLDLAVTHLATLCKSRQEDTEQVDLQSKIREIKRLGLILPSLTNLSEFDAFKRKIEQLMSHDQKLPCLETVL